MAPKVVSKVIQVRVKKQPHPQRPSLGLGMTRGLRAVSGPSACRGPCEPSHPAPLGPCRAGAALRVGPGVGGGQRRQVSWA